MSVDNGFQNLPPGPCKYCGMKILLNDVTHRGYHLPCFDEKVNNMALEYKALKIRNEQLAKALDDLKKQLDEK
jgi:hypothetical protein